MPEPKKERRSHGLFDWMFDILDVISDTLLFWH